MSNWQNLTSQVIDQCLGTFGEEVIYSGENLTPIRITAIFDNEFQQVDPDTGAVVISTQPMIGIKDNQLPQPPSKGDRVIIRDVEYKIIDHRQDGQGSSKLLLNKVA